MLFNLEFEVLTTRKPAQNQDFDSSKSLNHPVAPIGNPLAPIGLPIGAKGFPDRG